MSWVKLNFINYDITAINSNGYYISLEDKCIKDLNHNLIITVPFLISGYYELYKVELELKKTNLMIFVYINYDKLILLIKNNSIIPKRNELFEIFKNNIENFKYNENIFNIQKKFIYNKNLKNIIENLNKKIIVKTIKDYELEYNNLFINLNTQEFLIEKKKNLCICNSFILFDINTSYILLYKLLNNLLNSKILLVINIEKCSDINLHLIENMIYINTKNYKKILLSNLLNSKIIIIDYNVIKSRNYFKNYIKYHSSLDYKKGYKNFNIYINNLIKLGNQDINFYNIELLEFNNVIFFNSLNSEMEENNNFKFFNSVIRCTNKIFLQTEWNFNFNYNYYIKARPFLFNNDSILLDINFNKNFIENNIYFNVEIDNNKINYNETKIIRVCKQNTELINQSIKLYDQIILYEKIFEKKNIKYKYLLNNVKNKDKCPITYENLSNNIRVKCECMHEFTLIGFLNHLNYSLKCPICTRNLVNTEISIISCSKNITNLICSKSLYNTITQKKNTFNYILTNNLDNSNILNDRLIKINILLNKKRNLEFITLDNLSNISINNKLYKYINIIIIDNLELDNFNKYRTLKYIGNNISFDNLVINVVKCK